MESNVILEDYCSYEVAKLLKQKGFPFDRLEGGWQRLLDLNVMETYTTVTHAIARKWLRKKGIDIVITPLYKFKGGNFYCYAIYSETADIMTGRFDTYEQADDSALKYCLTEIL